MWVQQGLPSTAMSTSEISEMKSLYYQIFKYEDQQWNSMEIFSFRGQSKVFEDRKGKF